MMQRRIRLLLLFVALVGILYFGAAEAKTAFAENPASLTPNKVSIGVMRYDSKNPESLGQGYVASLNALSHKKWGDMGYWPFFAEVDSNGNLIALDENRLAVMEQENQYAYEAGVDYWSFLHNPDIEIDPVNGIYSAQFHRYLASSNKNLVKFTFILNTHTFATAGALDNALSYMTDPQYFTVLDGRPLVYIYNNTFNTDLSVTIPYIRNYLQEELELPNPYIVLYNESGYGEDAYAYYGPAHHAPLMGAPYSSLISAVGSEWSAQAGAHANYVPNAPHNWDNRPWYETPPPWGEAYGNPNYWSLPPSPDEYRQMLQSGVNFVLNNPDKHPAMTITTKEWNGQEEGGNIVPSLKYGAMYIDAMKLVNKSSVVLGPIVDSSLTDKMQFRVYNGSVNSDADADYSEAGGHSGNYSAVHWKFADYTVDTYQTLSGLANGTYTLKAWVKSSSNLGTSYMYVKDFGGAMKTCDIPLNASEWQQIVIPDVNVTNGQSTIGFYSGNTPASQWYRFDDVEFYSDSLVNVVENPGFELGEIGQNPKSWLTKGFATPAPDLNKYIYQTFADTPYTFQAGDYIEYDVKLLDNQSGAGGLDIYTTEQSYFRHTGWEDQNGVSGSPGADLSQHAYLSWYHRTMAVPIAMIGKTAEEWLVVGENDG